MTSSATPSPGDQRPVRVSVAWGGEVHSLRLTPEDWASILAGERKTLRGDRYWAEDGKAYCLDWAFAGGREGELEVTYVGPDALLDSGVGFIGRLADASIEPADDADEG